MAGSPLDRHGSSAAELKARLAAERRGTPFLVYRDGEGNQAIVELSGEHATVGRRPDNDVALPWDMEVSRLHAMLERVKGYWTLADEGLSRNGSYRNGERISGRQRLVDGDRLCFGETVVAYVAPARDQGSSTMTAQGPGHDVEVTETQRRVLAALCRPLAESAFATPATNKAIAEETFLSVDAVKGHLRVLFQRFDLADRPQNEKRASLAASALLHDVVRAHDL